MRALLLGGESGQLGHERVEIGHALAGGIF
jgi:hypothetical protein